MVEFDLSSLFASWLAGIRLDLGRYVVFAVGVWFILWVVLAPVLKSRKIRPSIPAASQLLLEFACSIRSIAVFTTICLSMFGLYYAGLLSGPKVAAAWGPVWFWVSVALVILAHDTWFYWTHRLIHHPRLFRSFHRRHHKSHNPSPFTAYSFDIGEAALNALFVPLWMACVPTEWSALAIFMAHQLVRNTLGHAGYELFPATRDGRPRLDWLTTVTHHDMHHGEAGWNFGLYFTFWDRLMGTEHPQYLARFAAVVQNRPAEVVLAPQTLGQAG